MVRIRNLQRGTGCLEKSWRFPVPLRNDFVPCLLAETKGLPDVIDAPGIWVLGIEDVHAQAVQVSKAPLKLLFTKSPIQVQKEAGT